MLQVPLESRVAVVPETVQAVGVIEANVTANPELAVADSVTGVPYVCVGIAGNVIVCVASVTAK
jgi:hypothetical protein